MAVYQSESVARNNPTAGATIDYSITHSGSSSGSSGGGGGSIPTPQTDASLGIVRDAGGNIIHDASAIINESARAQDIADISAASGITPPPSAETAQAQINIKTANEMLPSIELKLAGKLPLTGGETYKTLLQSKQVLEAAIKAESKTSGVSPSYGTNPQLIKGLEAYGAKKAAQLAQVNPELAKQYGTGTVELRASETPAGQGQMLTVKNTFKTAYAPVSMSDLTRQARTADIQYLSLQTGLPSSTIDANWGDFEGKLGKYSYTNLLKAGQAEAKIKGSAFVGGLGITLSSQSSFEKVLTLNGQDIGKLSDKPPNLFQEYWLELGEGLTSEEVSTIAGIDWVKQDAGRFSQLELKRLVPKRAGNILTINKLNGLQVASSTEPFNIYVTPTPKAETPEILQLNGVYYTKGDKTFATLATENIFENMNNLLESNRQTAVALDNNSSWNEQILNVPREFTIEVLTGLGTKSAIMGLHTLSAMKLSTELQLTRAFGGKLTTEQTAALPRIYEEARVGTLETLTEPAKLYAFNKIVQGIPKLGEWGGNAISKAIGSKTASNLVISGSSKLEASALQSGNQYVLGQFGKTVAEKLTTVGLVGSGALAGLTMETDESGGTAFSFNAPRAVGGVVTMGAFVVASNVVTSIGSKAWSMTLGKLGATGNKLPNPFQRSDLVHIKEGEARALTGQNTRAELEIGKLQAKGEAESLIALQKQAKADYKGYTLLAENAPITQKYGFQYKADRALSQIKNLQSKINLYVKQPESVSIVQGLAKEKVGGSFKWGTSITTTVSKPNIFGDMASKTTTVFKPFPIEGSRTFQAGRLVLSYNTGKAFGFEYPTSINKPFLALASAPLSSTSTISQPSIKTGVMSSSSGRATSGGQGLGLRQATKVRLPTTISVAIPPKITSISKTKSTTKVEPKVALNLITKTRVTPKVEIRAKESVLTASRVNVKEKAIAKYTTNLGLTERIQTKAATRENVKSSVREQLATKTNIRTQIREQIATKTLIRSQVRQRIGVKTLIRTRLNIRTPPRIIPRMASRGNLAIKPLGRLSLKSKGKRKGEKFVYADLLNASQSQFIYGKGTSPSKARPQTRAALGIYGKRLQTVEQLTFGANRGNINKFGGSNWNGGLSL